MIRQIPAWAAVQLAAASCWSGRTWPRRARQCRGSRRLRRLRRRRHPRPGRPLDPNQL